MKKPYIIGEKYRKWIPVPSYEFKMMENWLCDLAKEGLILTNIGFLTNIAIFEYQGPAEVKYRLDVIQEEEGILTEDPDKEQMVVHRKYSWEYAAKCKDFYIYRSNDPAARELHTDPDVQVLALNAVKKRARGAVIATIIMFLICPILQFMLYGRPAYAKFLGPHWIWYIFMLGLPLLVNELYALIRVQRIQRSLQDGEYDKSDTDWRKESRSYTARIIVSILFEIIFVVFFLIRGRN